jgi:hypothetical protein
MKKILVLITVLAFAFAAYAANKGPAEIDLSKKFDVPKTTKKAVIFPHAKHQATNECTDCHMSAEGGTALKSSKGGELKPGKVKGTSNKVHKEFCWPCHKAKKVKKGKSCSKCH